MSATLQSHSYRRSFNIWLRTGRWLEVPEYKQNGGNPNHDPDNGQFTFGPGGPRQGGARPEPAHHTPSHQAPSHQAKPATPPAPKPAKASPRNIAHGTNASAVQIGAETLAVDVISARLALPNMTPAARDQLEKFISGKRNPSDNMIYAIGSDGSNEVRDSPYIRDLDVHVQKEIASRNSGVIPDGMYIELTSDDIAHGKDKGDARHTRFMFFPQAGGRELALAFAPHVTLADVVGSFTNRLEVHVSHGKLTYRGVNLTSIASFAANHFRAEHLQPDKLMSHLPSNLPAPLRERIRNHVRDYVQGHELRKPVTSADIGSGPLGTVRQTIYFELPLKPPYIRKPK
jgi:hypothetical protein